MYWTKIYRPKNKSAGIFYLQKKTKVPEPVFYQKSPGTCPPGEIYTIMIGILYHTIPIGLLFWQKIGILGSPKTQIRRTQSLLF